MRSGRRLNFTLSELREIRKHPQAGVRNENDRPHPDFCWWFWERFGIALGRRDTICLRDDAARPGVEAR